MRTYITGSGRGNSGYDLLEETHLYEVANKGKTGESYLPLCSRGFNRYFGSGFSIFRGNVGSIGVCQVCEGRAQKQKAGLGWKRSRRTKKKIADKAFGSSPLLPGLPFVPDPKYFPKSQWELVDSND
jgi:hypothetical protein